MTATFNAKYRARGEGGNIYTVIAKDDTTGKITLKREKDELTLDFTYEHFDHLVKTAGMVRVGEA